MTITTQAYIGWRPARVALAVASAVLATASSLAAQESARSTPSTDQSYSWVSRVSVSGFTGQFRPRGSSDAFRLFDAALTSGTSNLTPQLTGGSLHVRVWRAASLVVDLSAGQRTVQSFSVALPSNSAAPVPQQTQLDVRSMRSLGVEWQVWAWQRSNARRPWVTLSAGAGAGQVAYALRQWGDFVDASRHVRFTDDLRSNGHGAFTYLSGIAQAPVTRWASLRVDVRRQYGSAGMNGDYSTFDALDLSGTRFGAGVVINAAGFSGRR